MLLAMTVKRRPPPSVVGYTLLNLVYVATALALSTSLWRHHLARGAGAAVIVLLILAAIVVWRGRWTWALMLLWAASVVLAPVWGGELLAVPFAVNLLSLALLLSRGMRRWVQVRRPAGLLSM
jgi:hypothetical protein